MPQSCRLKCQLEKVRKLSEEILTSCSSPDEWVHQVHSKANHALWFMGHMAMTDNYLLSVVAPEKQRDLPGYAERFGMGSVPVSDADSYPRPEDVLATMRERRQALLEVLDHGPGERPERLPDARRGVQQSRATVEIRPPARPLEGRGRPAAPLEPGFHRRMHVSSLRRRTCQGERGRMPRRV